MIRFGWEQQSVQTWRSGPQNKANRKEAFLFSKCLDQIKGIAHHRTPIFSKQHCELSY